MSSGSALPAIGTGRNLGSSHTQDPATTRLPQLGSSTARTAAAGPPSAISDADAEELELRLARIDQRIRQKTRDLELVWQKKREEQRGVEMELTDKLNRTKERMARETEEDRIRMEYSNRKQQREEARLTAEQHRRAVEQQAAAEEELALLKERLKALMAPHPPSASRAATLGFSQAAPRPFAGMPASTRGAAAPSAPAAAPMFTPTPPMASASAGTATSGQIVSPRLMPNTPSNIFTSQFVFGEASAEMGMLSPEPSTIITDSRGTGVAHGIGDGGPLFQAKSRRVGVSSQIINEDDTEKFVPKTYEKDAADMEILRNVISLNPLFTQLESEDLQSVLDAMRPVSYPAGHVILRQGEENDNFYVIGTGSVEVVKEDSVVCTFRAGQSFGELELMYNCLCAATVRTPMSPAQGMHGWALDRATYRHIVMQVSIQKRKQYEELLLKIPFLQQMEHYDILTLADALQPAYFKEGEYLLHYGDDGEWMHIILQGSVRVIGRDANNEPVEVCEFGYGDCIGELEFLYNHKCVADVVASSETKTAKLSRSHFEMCMGPLTEYLKGRAEHDAHYTYYQSRQGQSNAFNWSNQGAFFASLADDDAQQPSPKSAARSSTAAAHQQLVALAVANETSGSGSKPRRIAVSAAPLPDDDENWQPPVIRKTEEELQSLSRTLATTPTLFSQLEPRERQMVINAMARGRARRGEFVLTQGGPNDHYYVVEKGQCSVLIDGKVIRVVHPGEGFGELELLSITPCLATVRADTDTEMWVLDRETYHHIMISINKKKRALYESLLSKVDFLKSMPHKDLLQLADAVQPAEFKAGEKIIEFGSEGEWMHIVLEGTVEVLGRKPLANGKEEIVHVCELGHGDPIGELEFIHNHRCVADVVAKTDVRTIKLNRPHFEMCMGPVLDILKKREATKQYEYYSSFSFGAALMPKSQSNTGGNKSKSNSNKSSPEKDGDPHHPTNGSNTEINANPFSFANPKGEDDEEGSDGVNGSDEEQTDDAGEEEDAISPTPPVDAPVSRRTAVSAKQIDDEDFEPVFIEKSPETLAALEKTLRGNPLFMAVESEELRVISRAMDSRSYKEGEVILKQGEENETLYVIASGEVHIIRDAKFICAFGPGRCFGELELMYSAPCAASVQAKKDTLCWILHGELYKRIVMKQNIAKRKLYQELLGGLDLLKSMTSYELTTLADCLVPAIFEAGEKLLRFGDPPEWMHIIIDGTVEVWGRDADGSVMNVCSFGPGEPVGDLEFLNNHNCTADVVATSKVKTVKLNRNHFEMCMGPIAEVLVQHSQDDRYQYYRAFNFAAMEGGGAGGAGAPENQEMNEFLARMNAPTPPTIGSPTQQGSFRSRGAGAGGASSPTPAGAGGLGSSQKSAAGLTPAPPTTSKPSASVGRSGAGDDGGRSRRVAVASSVKSETNAQTLQKYPKNETDLKAIKAALCKRALFVHLEDGDLNRIAEAMPEKSYPKGGLIEAKGAYGDHLYIIVTGAALMTRVAPSAKVSPSSAKDHNNGNNNEQRLGPGDVFGDEQLMYSAVNPFQVEAVEPVRAFALSREAYQSIVAQVSKQRRELYTSLLGNVEFFKTMTSEQMLTLADALQAATFAPGDVIIHYGAEAEWMHIILEGTVEVWGRGNQGETVNVCEFSHGEIVGELEFMNKHACVADVIAKTAVKTAKLNRNHFELCMGPIVELLKKHATSTTYSYYSAFDFASFSAHMDDPKSGLNASRGAIADSASVPPPSSSTTKTIGSTSSSGGGGLPILPSPPQRQQTSSPPPVRKQSFKRRSGVSSRRMDQTDAEGFEAVEIPKSDADKDFLRVALLSKPLFSHMESEMIDTIIGVMAHKSFLKGETLTLEGKEEQFYFVIKEGECDETERNSGQKRKLTAGDSFGEATLIYSLSCPTTVVVSTARMEAFVLPQAVYRGVLARENVRKRKQYEKLLSNIRFLQSMTQAELLHLADALQTVNFKEGEYLIQYGTEGEFMYILLNGEVEVIGRDDFGNKISVCTFGHGQPLGELEFINKHPCVADVVAKTAVKAARLERRHFELALGPVIDVLKRNASTQPEYAYYSRVQSKSKARPAGPTTDATTSSSSVGRQKRP